MIRLKCQSLLVAALGILPLLASSENAEVLQYHPDNYIQVTQDLDRTYLTGLASDFGPVSLKYNAPNHPNITLACDFSAGTGVAGDVEDLSSYIFTAFKQELGASGWYQDSASTVLAGRLDDATFYLDQFPGENIVSATWRFSLTLTSSTGVETSFASSHSYAVLDAENLCGGMADQFMPGVQALMAKILGSEKFIHLITS